MVEDGERDGAAGPAVEPMHLVQTVAGCGRTGGNDGPAKRACFSSPHNCLPLPDGSLLVADHLNNALRRVHSAGGRVVVETVGQKTSWLRPKGLALLPDGDVLVCDSGHNRLRRLSFPDGQVSTFAGNGKKGHRDGIAEKATFDAPCDVFVCTDGTVLVTDGGNRCLRTISAASGRLVVATLEVPAAGQDGSSAFVQPTSAVAVGGADSIIYVADAGCHAVFALSRRAADGAGGAHDHPMDGAYTATVVAGCSGRAGLKDGALATSMLAAPAGLALSPDGRLLVSDAQNNCVRRVCFSSRKIGRAHV